MEKDRFAIGKAAEYLQVSVDTLRRWDASGKLRALRSAGGHRYYPKEQLERFALDIEATARVWAESSTAPELPLDQYCHTHDIFTARLDTLSALLYQNADTKEMASLLVAVIGEIGNNSFDHNFGNWPDVPGIFFSYNTDKRIILLADRGVGVRATLLRVRPNLKDDRDALQVAFREHVSGRAPEQRGNGLKFVHNVAVGYSLGISLHSGTAVAEIARDKGQFGVRLAERNVRGTITKITY